MGIAQSPSPALLSFDQLDLIAVRILDEGDDAAAVLHRSGRAGNLDAFLSQFLAGAVDIRNADREMSEAAADGIGFLLAPVVGQFDHRMRLLVAEAHKSQGEL